MKVGKQWRQILSLFETYLKRKYIREMVSTLREYLRLRVFENRVLRGIF
jgi:hypothetical protein